MGRPTKRTPELEEKVFKLLAAGLNQKQACAVVGVSHEQFSRWGKQFPQLRERCQGLRILALIDKTSPEWQLERCFPEQFGRKADAALAVNNVIKLSIEDSKTIENRIADSDNRIAKLLENGETNS